MPQRPESVKRRILWINDEDWAAITDRATAAGKTASAFVRERALAPSGALSSPRPAPKPSSKR